ncbi:hypothetical protein BOW13_07225 [Solemya velum gill symbiont]|nr:hypothetical protein BOV93_08810 [Solemya velum gill symbiont]OOY60490.1 hypothetical protein BOW02_05650 [Solemya velum gill symbiont]OOY61614.1 hypothetical protein BOW04_09465 [Solemya velum gill symbiont]OOY65355.1 hypothetical protein BOW05_05760 [Solemya velum gill symbiont]OOY72879.1 hypothetical protein BOW08_03975 [Solemya velum gill symbiont]
MVIAVVCYLAAVICGIAAFYLDGEVNPPVIASLMASVVFFIGSGIVLHVIATVNMPDLKLRR